MRTPNTDGPHCFTYTASDSLFFDTARVTTTVDMNRGTPNLISDSSFFNTPTPRFNGFNSFILVANDGFDNPNVATVSIILNEANDLPSAIDDTANTTKTHRTPSPS